MITSPLESSGIRVLMRSSTAGPALTIIITFLGAFREATSSWSVWQPTTLGCLPRLAVKASVTLVVRLKTAIE